MAMRPLDFRKVLEATVKKILIKFKDMLEFVLFKGINASKRRLKCYTSLVPRPYYNICYTVH